MTTEDYILDRSIILEDGCWIWTQCVNADGYGVAGRKLAHRVSYEIFVGPIPNGLTVDHRCFKEACVNPNCLRLMTNKANAARQRKALSDHCGKGLHEMTEANTYRRPEGRRGCRRCRADSSQRVRDRKAAA